MADRTNTPTAREAESDAQPGDAAAAQKAGGGRSNSWLPLLAMVVVMPVLAYGTVQFVLLPKVKAAMGQGAAAPAADADPAAAAGKDGAPGAAGEKILVQFPPPPNKLLVNVAGSMMTRYLTMSITLVGTVPDFKEKITKDKDQLLDLANGALMTKTIQDLEKPGSRNVIRSELMTVFNNALGGPFIKDIYITEQAIQ